jgi:uncharacterized protein
VIVDAHAHVKGGDVFRRELDPDATIARMDEAGIDRSCVFSICLPSYDSNELTHAAVAGRDRLIPFAHVVPQEGIAATLELERAVERLGFRGLKLHCGEVHGEVTATLFLPTLEQAAAYRLPIIFDCIDRPEIALACAEAVPQAHLIMAHMGSCQDQFMVDRFIDIAYRHENVWLDTSFSSCPWKMVDAVRLLGPTKLIFGSDGGGDYYPAIIELTKVKAYIRDRAALSAILGDNVAALLDDVR